MRNRIIAAAGIVAVGVGILAVLASQPTEAAAPTRTTVQAHAIEITAPPVTVTKVKKVSQPPVTVVVEKTRTIVDTPPVAIAEDSLPVALDANARKGGDIVTGAKADSWANASDATGTKHTGCYVVLGDTSQGACPDGYTFSS